MALCFMFPVLNGKYSGALNVALSLATLSARQGFSIKILDYEGGLLRSNLISNGVEFDFISLGSSRYVDKINNDDTIFGFNNDLYVFPVIFDKNPKVFIYDVYYPFWRNFIRPAGVRLPFEETYLDALAKSRLFEKAAAFMEKKGVDHLARRIPAVSASECRVVPVSVAVPNLQGHARSALWELRLTYIGRSEAWKLFPLLKFIDDLVVAPGFANRRVVFNVVVSDISVAREMIAAHCGTKLNIDFYFFENLSAIELEKFICENTDVGLAMGTSVLEFGRHGVPCIVLDFSHRKIDGDVGYRWLHEADGFSLGGDLEDTGCEKGRALTAVLGDYLSDPALIAQKCYEYTRDNHNRDINYLRLLSYVSDASVRVNDVHIPHFSVMNFLQEFRRKIRGRSKYERY